MGEGSGKGKKFYIKGMRKIKSDKMRGQVESLKLGGQGRFNSKYQ